MRPLGLVLPTLLLACNSAAAQPTPPAAQPSPMALLLQIPKPLKDCLERWEKEMFNVQTIQAQLVRTDKDVAYNKTKKYVGYAQYLREVRGQSVVNLASMELRPQDRQTEIAEKYLCTGTHIYQYMPSQMEVRQYELPKPAPGQPSQDNLIGFLFGMKAEDAVARYEMSMPKQDDKYYIFIDIKPRLPTDKAEFQTARLVLDKQTFLPRQLWFHNAENEVTWEIPDIRKNVQVNRAVFEAPKAPWKIVVVPRQDPQPRIIHNGGAGR